MMNANKFENHKKAMADDSFSYKALMELKGSKCTCMPKFSASSQP